MQDFFHEVFSSSAFFDRFQCMQIQIFEDSKVKFSSFNNMIHDFINHFLKISSLSNYWHYDEIFFLKVFELFVKFFSWVISFYLKWYFFNYFFHVNMSLCTIIDSFSLRHVFSFKRYFFRFFMTKIRFWTKWNIFETRFCCSFKTIMLTTKQKNKTRNENKIQQI